MKRSVLFLVLSSIAYAGVAHADALEDAVVQQAKQQEKGANQVGEFFKGNGKKTDYQVLLEAGQCYWFSGASEGLKKLYMYLWPPNSNPFTMRVADVKTDGKGTMAHCATVSGMFKFQVKADGSGNYVIGVFSKVAPKQPPPPPVEVVKGPDLGPLCDKVASAAAKGAKREGEFFDGKGNSIGHDDRIDYSIQMDAGKCYWVIGCGEPEKVKSLYLYLWGPDNKRISEAKSDTHTPMIGHCAKETGMFKVQAKMNSGNGSYKVAVYTKGK